MFYSIPYTELLRCGSDNEVQEFGLETSCYISSSDRKNRCFCCDTGVHSPLHVCTDRCGQLGTLCQTPVGDKPQPGPAGLLTPQVLERGRRFGTRAG